MTSFAKKGLFLTSVLLISFFGSLSLSAQEEAENVGCKVKNGGECRVAGKPGVCSDFMCNTSTESQSGTTYPAVERLARETIDGMKSGLEGFRRPLEVAAATTTNPGSAQANKDALTAFNANYGKLEGIFVQMQKAYDDELSSQRGRDISAKDAHYAAVIKADQRRVEIYNSDIRPLLSSSTFPPTTRAALTTFYTSVTERSRQFVDKASQIQRGASVNDASVQPTNNVAADAERAATAAGNTGSSETCDSFFKFSMGACINAAVSWVARAVFVNIGFFAIYLAGLFLHFTIHFGLVSMKSLITEDVYTLWLFTRNLALAGCLFATLYFVGMYLVGLGEKIQKQAAAVILFAIFSGFSFSLSTYLIDGSTLITTSLYGSIASDWASPSRFVDPVIAVEFMKLLGYQGWSSIFGAVEPDSVLGRIAQGNNPFAGVALNLLVAATLLYDAYILLMMGMLFLVRNIGLFVCVIFSPLLLIDKAIPKLSEWADWYRKFFFGLLALGPVFMFLMYIALKVTKVIIDGTKTIGQTSTPNEGLLIFQIFAVTAIFYFTYKTCRSLSGALGDAVHGAVSGIAGKAMMATPLGMAGRVAAFAGQNTVGRLARRSVREGGVLSNMKEKGGYFGRAAFSAANYAGNTATYDFNNTKAFAGTRANLEKRAGMTSSEGAVGKALGYADTRTKIRDETINHANEIKSEDGRRNVIERGARRFDRATSILPSVGVLDRAGNKFLGGNDKGSLRGDRRGALETELRRGISTKAKSAIKDDVGKLDLENYLKEGSTDEEKKRIEEERKTLLKDFSKIYADSRKGGKDVQDYASDVFNRKLVEEFAKAIKNDKTLDPLSPTFERDSLKKFQEFSKGISDQLGLEGQDRLEINGQNLDKFSLQMGMFVTKKKKEDNEIKRIKAERGSPQAVAPSQTAEETQAAGTQNLSPDDLSGTDMTSGLEPSPRKPSPTTTTAGDSGVVPLAKPGTSGAEANATADAAT